MIVALALSCLVPAITGTLLLRLWWPSRVMVPWWLLLALGAGFGMGLASVLLCFYVLGFGPTPAFPFFETALAGLVAVLAFKLNQTRLTGSGTPSGRPSSRLLLLLGLVFLLTTAAAAGAFLSIMRQQPHGGWDAWMNWGLRARMLFRGGDAWQNAFSSTFPWSHPDYPLLVPSLVVRAWLYAGREALLGPALVAMSFTFGTVYLLTAALATLRSTSQGLLAGIVLLSTPFFILHGTSLYADVPLAFFFLATMICLELDARHRTVTVRFGVLAGMAAGFAMWTKNEGILFTLAIAAGLVFAGMTEAETRWHRRLRALAIGLIPMLLLVIGFKAAFAPPNDLLSTLSVDRTLGRLADPERYLMVLREYARHISSFGANRFGSAVWVLLAYVLLVGVSRSRLQGSSFVRAGSTAMVLLLAGHFMVFVSMAHELPRLLDSSLDRLLLQLWPSALFLFFLVVRAPEEALVPAQRSLVGGTAG
jgi:hypothetical protein